MPLTRYPGIPAEHKIFRYQLDRKICRRKDKHPMTLVAMRHAYPTSEWSIPIKFIYMSTWYGYKTVFGISGISERNPYLIHVYLPSWILGPTYRRSICGKPAQNRKQMVPACWLTDMPAIDAYGHMVGELSHFCFFCEFRTKVHCSLP